MCTFESDLRVLVCDAAIEGVKARVGDRPDGAVRYTAVDGRGTLVEVSAGVDADGIVRLVKLAIAAANGPA